MRQEIKKFIENNVGTDKLRGRPIRLNRQTLKIKKDKDYAELLFVGDIHLGYPTANVEKFQEMLEYALQKEIYVLLMGDLLEAGLRDSIGDSVYRQKLDPQAQMDKMIEMLEPLAAKGLIIGMHSGNHENRITLKTGIDITRIMSKLLGVPYLGFACWSLLSVMGIRYSLYSTHGTSGSIQEITKLNAAVKLGKIVSADIVAYGHVHSIASEIIIRQYFHPKFNRIIEDKQYICLTGSYLEWDGSYAQMKSYPISKMGSPKIKISSNKKSVHFSA